MKRGLVLVEGQTEERFVNECLGPYLLAKGLVLVPTTVKTKRVIGGAPPSVSIALRRRRGEHERTGLDAVAPSDAPPARGGTA